MHTIHSIRLRGPWQVQVLETNLPTMSGNRGTMNCPTSWFEAGWLGFCGKVRYIRNFGAPTGLGPEDQLWLVIEPCSGNLLLQLNGSALAPLKKDEKTCYDISKIIKNRNQLIIDLTGDNNHCGLTGEVRLEIRSIIKS